MIAVAIVAGWILVLALAVLVLGLKTAGKRPAEKRAEDGFDGQSEQNSSGENKT
jgi:hypothetical protein